MPDMQGAMTLASRCPWSELVMIAMQAGEDRNPGWEGGAICQAEYCPAPMPVHGAVGCREVQPEVTGLSQAREAQQ